MVLSSFPYLLWGARNGTCRFSVYMFFLGIPWTYPNVLYIAGKTFSREIQRSWNRGKRFSGDGVIQETSLMIMAHRGGIESGVLNRHSGGSGGDVRVLSTLPGTLEKGGLSIILEFSTTVQPGTQVMIRPSLISSISPLTQYGSQPNLISMESYVQGVWMRTCQGHWVLPENQLFRLDKDY